MVRGGGRLHDHPEDRPSRAPRHPPDVPSGDGPRLVSSAHRCYGRDLAASRGDAPRGRSPSRTDRAFCDPSFGKHQEVTHDHRYHQEGRRRSRLRLHRRRGREGILLPSRRSRLVARLRPPHRRRARRRSTSKRAPRARAPIRCAPPESQTAPRLRRPVFGRAVRMSGPPAHGPQVREPAVAGTRPRSGDGQDDLAARAGAERGQRPPRRRPAGTSAGSRPGACPRRPPRRAG